VDFIKNYLRENTHKNRVKADLQVQKYLADQFSVLAENAGSLIFMVQQGRYFYVNQAFNRTTGYTADELYQMKDAWGIVAPEHQKLIKERAQALESGEQVQAKSEYKIINKDGEARWIEYSGVVIDYAGKPAILGSSIDITERKRAEESYRESELLYQTIFETSGTAMMISGEDMQISLVNQKFEKLSGYSKEEIENKKNWKEFIVEDNLSNVQEYYKKRWIDAASVPPNYEFKFLNRLREIRDIYITVNFIPGSKKSVISFVDITERKKTETEREALLLLLQAMFNEHTAVMLLIEPLTGKIIDANPAACIFYGYAKEELINLHIQDINLLPEEGLKKRIHMVLEGKQRYFLFPHRLKCGEIRLVDVYSCPVIHKGEKTLYSIIFDVTEREKYKEELYWEKELLRSTLLSIGDGVVTTDQQGKVTSINKVAEQLTGWTQEEAIGKPLEEVFNIINECTRERCENPVHKVLEIGNTIELANHTILISKEGIERSIEDSAAPIRDEDGKIKGVVLVFRDFTEKKAKQAKVEYLSFHDQLTGLYNRSFFEEELKRLDTERNLPLTLVIVDINGLKLTNDAFGHSIGDRLLQKAAEVMKNECRADDIIARIGGDEFAILLPKTDSDQDVMIVNRMNGIISNEKVDSIMLSISFGWETKQQAAENMTVIFKKAEDYMYRHKLSESKSMRHKTIEMIIKTLYEKNAREQQHSARVSQLCVALGVALGLREGHISELRTVGLMHDIGKITIDDRLLDKPGPFSTEEWVEMKRHAETGYRILSSVNEFAPLAEYVLAHHERWDGKGYPKGLKGEEIPLEARIIAVADTYDAMTRDRPYRKTLSEEATIEEIKRNAGIQFDPYIARVFVESVLGNK